MPWDEGGRSQEQAMDRSTASIHCKRWQWCIKPGGKGGGLKVIQGMNSVSGVRKEIFERELTWHGSEAKRNGNLATYYFPFWHFWHGYVNGHYLLRWLWERTLLDFGRTCYSSLASTPIFGKSSSFHLPFSISGIFNIQFSALKSFYPTSLCSKNEAKYW